MNYDYLFSVERWDAVPKTNPGQLLWRRAVATVTVEVVGLNMPL